MMRPYSSYRDAALRYFVLYAVPLHLLISAISGQVCTAPHTVGSLNHDEVVITEDQIYILTGYTVQCEGIVTTWEFCYQIQTVSSVTFYPSIWQDTGMRGMGSNTIHRLVQSNNVTFTPNGVGPSYSCQNYTLPVAEQFTAPKGSVVGLYSNKGTVRPLLLHTDRNNNQITTYQVAGNQSSVSVGNGHDANYNIAIRLYLEVVMSINSAPVLSITLTSVMATTSTSVMATTSTPVMSTTSTPVMTTTSTPVMATTSTSVMATTSTPVMTTTSTPVMSTTSTPVMATTSIPVMTTASTPVMTTASTPVMATASTPVITTSSTPVMATTSTSVMSTTSTSAMSTTSTSVMATTSTSIMTTTSTPDMSTTSTSVMVTTSTSVMTTTSTLVMSTTSTSVMSTTSTPVMSTSSTSVMATTSTSVMVTTSASVMATTSTPVMTTTSTPVMTTTSTPVMATTSTPVMTTASTPVMATTSTSVMAATSTPVMTTASTPVMTTTSTPAMVTTSVINTVGGVNENTDSSSSSSGAAGIAAGCVIGVVICIIIVLLIILLLWYRKRKKGKLNIEQVNIELENCTKNVDDSSQYSAVGKPLNNGTIVIKNPGPDYETPEFWRDDVYKSTEPVPYLAPDSTIGRNLPKVESNDYEALENVDIYSSALYTYSDTVNNAQVPSDIYDDTKEADYTEVPDIDEDTKESIVGDTGTGGEEEEEVFLDPGHSEEAIYSCFERKMFRTIKADNVKILQKLGSGEFGVVHLGTWSDRLASHKQVAVKTLNSECSISDRIKFLREAAIMGQFKDNHIVELYGVITEKENTMIILEYMCKGDLREFLIDLKATTPPEAFGELKHDLLSFCRHVAAGLNYLTNKHFVHRDLAARNILVSSDDVCKIADFGMARDVTDDTYYMSTGGKIPVKWTAPEAIFYKKYSTQSDVWSFGCVMYEVWSLGHKPFEESDGKEYLTKIITGYRMPPPPGCPKSIYKLMIECWNPIVNKRIIPSELSRTLQKSDRTLLPSSTTLKDSEELSTTLGASLDTSSHIFTDLQNTYLPK